MLIIAAEWGGASLMLLVPPVLFLIEVQMPTVKLIPACFSAIPMYTLRDSETVRSVPAKSARA